MKKMLKDGWYTIGSYDVYVDDGKVKKALHDGKGFYPYTVSKYGGYDLNQSLSLDALRARLRRNTAIFA